MQKGRNGVRLPHHHQAAGLQTRTGLHFGKFPALPRGTRQGDGTRRPGTQCPGANDREREAARVLPQGGRGMCPWVSLQLRRTQGALRHSSPSRSGCAPAEECSCWPPATLRLCLSGSSRGLVQLASHRPCQLRPCVWCLHPVISQVLTRASCM